MNRNELRKADINLMVVFEALMLRAQCDAGGRETVSRPADHQFGPQPFAYLVQRPVVYSCRPSHGAHRAGRGDHLSICRRPWTRLSSALSLTHDFDPSISTMTFRIGLSDDVEFGLLPPLLRALRQEAPQVVFVVQHVDYWRIPDLLASGDITVGITQTRGLPANAKRKLLRHIRPPASCARMPRTHR